MDLRCGILSFALLLPVTGMAVASGHGPVFGLTTPTNARRAWALDVGVMGRSGTQRSGVMIRSMISYGVTEDFQLSVTVPYVFSRAALPPARTTSMMSSTPDFEGIAAWRFHRQGMDVGTRFETTVYAGLVLPGVQRAAGMLGDLRRTAGVYTAIASGVASRSHYLWLGVGNLHFAERDGDRRPNLFTYSAVWGYRPKTWRKDYPQWDWRLFAEMTGEVAGDLRRGGVEMPSSRTHQLFLGPTLLGIYKNVAIEGGLQFPLYRDGPANLQREQLRFAINFSYFF